MDEKLPLFNLFTIREFQTGDRACRALTETLLIVFEIVSAYGAIGLSIGLPNANYSTSGAFSPVSKLVLIMVMIRARHRGLPAAIDRAVMLPRDEKKDLQELVGGARENAQTNQRDKAL